MRPLLPGRLVKAGFIVGIKPRNIFEKFAQQTVPMQDEPGGAPSNESQEDYDPFPEEEA